MNELAASPASVAQQESPLESLCAFVAGASALFYWAEKDANPDVQTYWDAVHYIATSLSVGYAKIFPVTQVGKIIGAAVMTVGPAMAAQALDRPTASTTDPALLAKLDDILTELKKLRTA